MKLAPDQAALFDFHATAENLGRILVAPPGLPAERLARLRDGVKTALHDPELIAEGEKTQRYVDFIDAEETRKATISVVTSPTPDQKKRMMDIISKVEKK